MENTCEEKIRNYFSKYVKTAVLRVQKNYIEKKYNLQYIEETMEPEQVWLTQTQENFSNDIADTLLRDTGKWTDIEEQVSDRMKNAIEDLTDKEAEIVFLKVYKELTFREIAVIMQMDWRKVASIYSYARKKMKKGWEKYEL